MFKSPFFKGLLRTQKQRTRYVWAMALVSIVLAAVIADYWSPDFGFIGFFVVYFTIAHPLALIICAFEELMS